MARLTKTLKKELKTASLPGTMGHTCEFVRSHIEALHSNHRKSIKMLNSVVQMAGEMRPAVKELYKGEIKEQ